MLLVPVVRFFETRPPRVGFSSAWLACLPTASVCGRNWRPQGWQAVSRDTRAEYAAGWAVCVQPPAWPSMVGQMRDRGLAFLPAYSYTGCRPQ